MTTHKILFSHQHSHFINVIFVDTLEELKIQWDNVRTKYPDNEILGGEFDNTTGGFCAYNYKDGHDLGDLVFLNKMYPVVVHECVHAAIAFIDNKVMSSKIVGDMAQDEQHEYYHEALATTVEVLFAQIQEIIENGLP